MEIYIHIPFCVRKCKYCAFFSIANRADLFDAYVSALTLEIERRSVDEPIETIYIGGGTPTVLSLDQLSRIVDALERNFSIRSNVEFTVEVNPGTVERNDLIGLRALGINRLSIGVQSFDDRLLRSIGRIHTSTEAIEIVRAARAIFDNVGVDLIYSLPHQSLDDLKRSIDWIKKLDVEHVSSYGLEVEESTEFYRLQRLGRLELPSEEEDAAMYDFVTTELPRLGWHRYEVSNFAKPGFESRHNLGYWSDEKYLGLGAGASSYDRLERRANVEDVEEYIDGLRTGRDVSRLEEIVDRKAAIEEYFFLGLRKTSGVSMSAFEKKFGASIEETFVGVVSGLVTDGLIEIEGDRLKMTEHGMKFGNVVFEAFLF